MAERAARRTTTVALAENDVNVPNWETCADGSVATGSQAFTFYPADSDGNIQWGRERMQVKTRPSVPAAHAESINGWL